MNQNHVSASARAAIQYESGPVDFEADLKRPLHFIGSASEAELILEKVLSIGVKYNELYNRDLLTLASVSYGMLCATRTPFFYGLLAQCEANLHLQGILQVPDSEGTLQGQLLCASGVAMEQPRRVAELHNFPSAYTACMKEAARLRADIVLAESPKVAEIIERICKNRGYFQDKEMWFDNWRGVCTGCCEELPKKTGKRKRGCENDFHPYIDESKFSPSFRLTKGRNKGC
ncbi:MAG: hypothetical protein CMA10_07105 [Euryarchaeota archaeon]|nr:hypothetical protein [Euryarchaeota archaeon]|tara:strand:+ start:8246 stop:8938 length:693 start_codon:yes stop_codon:yes gene_type:complete